MSNHPADTAHGFYGVTRALRMALADCHGGQWTQEYRVQCRLTRRLRGAGVPVPESVRDLTAGERVVYRRACRRLLDR